MKTPVTLHLEIGAVLTTMLDKFGVEAWNLWVASMVDRLPMSWSQDQDEPPAHLSFDVGAMNFSGRKIDGIDLGLVGCEGANFEGSHALGALFASVPHANFRFADLREAVFIGDISGADFTGARTEGVCFVDASYDRPPIGLAEDLLATCRGYEPLGDQPADWPPAGIGLAYPVNIGAALTASASG